MKRYVCLVVLAVLWCGVAVCGGCGERPLDNDEWTWACKTILSQNKTIDRQEALVKQVQKENAALWRRNKALEQRLNTFDDRQRIERAGYVFDASGIPRWDSKNGHVPRCP